MSHESLIWFITGISHGLGRVFAEAALAGGKIVIGTSRDGHSDLDPGRGELHVLAMQPTSAASVRAAVARAHAIHGRFDVVVNHAGDVAPGGAEAAQVFDLNFLGPLRVMQAVLPYLREQQHGHILDIASNGGLAPRAGWDVYAAAKAAVEGRSRNLAQELRQGGIEIERIEPQASAGWRARAAAREGSPFAEDPGDAVPSIRPRAVNRPCRPAWAGDFAHHGGVLSPGV